MNHLKMQRRLKKELKIYVLPNKENKRINIADAEIEMIIT
jgi:hypothetical protein